jgi:hypothetical protein
MQPTTGEEVPCPRRADRRAPFNDVRPLFGREQNVKRLSDELARFKLSGFQEERVGVVNPPLSVVPEDQERNVIKQRPPPACVLPRLLA